MSWLFEDAYEHRDEAQTVLDRVKTARRNKKTRILRLDENTWIEQTVDSKPIEQNMKTKTITRQEAEQAIALYRTAKMAKKELEEQMAEAERTVEAFGQANLQKFVDGRLELDSGMLAIRAGLARPLKAGKTLSTAARAELAAVLPQAYVRQTCDFGTLFACQDKMVRQMLRSRGIEIVREDKFVIL